MASKRTARLLEQVKVTGVGMLAYPTERDYLDTVSVLRKWEALESIGAVRLQRQEDKDFDPSEFENPEDYEGMEAYGSIGEYRSDFDDMGEWDSSDTVSDWRGITWQHADSVWGHVGYRNVLSWQENCYIVGITGETITRFAIAWREHLATKLANSGKS